MPTLLKPLKNKNPNYKTLAHTLKTHKNKNPHYELLAHTFKTRKK